MTGYPAYTRDEWVERGRSIIRALQADARGVRNADVTVGGDYDLTARMLGWLAHLLQETGKGAIRALDKRQSFGAFLRQHASNAAVGATLQETTQSAVKARGKLVVTATTSDVQSITAGSVFLGPDGSQYTVDSTVTTPIWSSKTFTAGHRSTRYQILLGATFFSSGAVNEVYVYAPTQELFAVRASTFYPYRILQPYLPLLDDPSLGDSFARTYGTVVDVTASVAGAAGNREPRDTMAMSSWPGTFNAAKVLWVDGGRDALTPSQMQQALRDLYGTRLETITLEQIRRAALATPRLNLNQAYVYPGESSNGNGEYFVVPTGRVYSISSTYERDAVASYLATQATPADQFAAGYVDAAPVDWLVTMRVSPDFAPDYKFDPTFSQAFTGASTTTRLKYSTTLPTGSWTVGDRILISMSRGAGNDEDSCLVERAISAIGSDYLDVSAPLPFAPTRAVVSQSGPYGGDFITACESFFDNQAPNIDNAYRYPNPYSTSALAAFTARIGAVRGVVDVVVTEPNGTAVLGNAQVFYPMSITLQVWS